MKIVAFILASMVLFLSTQCMIMESNIVANKVKAKKSCCSKKNSCNETKKKGTKNTCASVCNPFMFCSGCMYESAVKTVLVVPYSLYESVQNGFKKDLFISSYISSMWNPPEFI